MRPDTFIDSQSAGPDRANRRGFSRGLPRVLCVPVLVVFYYVFTPFEKPAPAGQGNTNKQKRKEGKKAKKHRKKPPTRTPGFWPGAANMFEVRARCQVFLCRGFWHISSFFAAVPSSNGKPKTENRKGVRRRLAAAAGARPRAGSGVERQMQPPPPRVTVINKLVIKLAQPPASLAQLHFLIQQGIFTFSVSSY